MALADIPNPKPFTKPAVPEKVFDRQFCTELRISAHPGRPWSARFIGVAHDGVDLEMRDQMVIQLEDLKVLAAYDPELAQAMGAVLSVIGKYLVKCKAKGVRTVTVDNIKEVLK